MTSSKKYDSNKSTLPNGVANYIYGPRTGNANLRKHLYQMHAKEYDRAVLQHKWTYKLSTELDTPAHNARLGTPIISPAAILEDLVVAGDQVSPNIQSIQDSPW